MKKNVLCKLPSGKSVPEDRELIVFSVDQLEGFQYADLSWFENYALDKRNGAADKNQAVKWDDFLRRVDIAINQF